MKREAGLYDENGNIIKNWKELIDLGINRNTRISSIMHENNLSGGLVLPDGIKKVPSFAFCSTLTAIDIPDSVEYIHDMAFVRCKQLKTVKLPKKIKINKR